MTNHRFEVSIGPEEIVLRNVYQTISIINDILIAAWFISGSILFFYESTTTMGTWFFLIGSIELMIRPIIRLTRNIHIKRHTGLPAETDDDF